MLSCSCTPDQHGGGDDRGQEPEGARETAGRLGQRPARAGHERGRCGEGGGAEAGQGPVANHAPPAGNRRRLHRDCHLLAKQVVRTPYRVPRLPAMSSRGQLVQPRTALMSAPRSSKRQRLPLPSRSRPPWDCSTDEVTGPAAVRRPSGLRRGAGRRRGSRGGSRRARRPSAASAQCGDRGAKNGRHLLHGQQLGRCRRGVIIGHGLVPPLVGETAWKGKPGAAFGWLDLRRSTRSRAPPAVLRFPPLQLRRAAARPRPPRFSAVLQ